MYCQSCGNKLSDAAQICPRCGCPCSSKQTVPDRGVQDRKTTAGVLGMTLGSFGVHKFYLGYTGAGIIEILLTVFTCGLAGWIGLIEGIIYLTQPDSVFEQNHCNHGHPWF